MLVGLGKLQSAKKKIQSQETFLSAIINTVPMGVVIANPDGFVRYVNQAAHAYLSLPALTHLHRIHQLYPKLFNALSEMRRDEVRTVAI